jgi:IclR family acetate operon transcriptional repressor
MSEPLPASVRAKPRVQSVARAAAILVAVGESESGLTTKEISESVEINRQTAYHLIHTLTGAGLLTRNERGLCVLGLRVGTLAEGFRRHLAPPERLAAFVRRIASETGETAYAAGWVEGEIVTLSVVRGQNAIQASAVPQGLAADGHARASGKLLLAYATPGVRADYLEHHPLTPRTPHTITSRDRLEAELDEIRRLGYATDREEFTLGLCCLAVPLDDGGAPYTFGVSAPAERFTTSFTAYLEIMTRAAGLATGRTTDEG